MAKKPGFKITELWAFVSVDPNDGEEGIMAQLMPSPHSPQDLVWMPLVCADQARFDSFKPVADLMAEVSGIPYKIKHFVLQE